MEKDITRGSPACQREYTLIENITLSQRQTILLLGLAFFRSKVDQVQDIVTGNPTVIKMVVSFNRGARGQNTLRQLLAPVVKEILDDNSLVINTNPVEVYKAWVNQLETQTGEARYQSPEDVIFQSCFMIISTGVGHMYSCMLSSSVKRAKRTVQIPFGPRCYLPLTYGAGHILRVVLILIVHVVKFQYQLIPRATTSVILSLGYSLCF